MTPQEKANQLVHRYYRIGKKPLISFWKDISHAKKCAIEAVDEILSLPVCWYGTSASLEEDGSDTLDYWELVKKEIPMVGD